ncbi:iron-sulfur cluster assembly accessory protein [Candidatus Woesearchaeota archaeon]|nr:MAG: iron-sulfur cluster assembly accessory protein [Candidatus Woesearchaeota archaeon]
METNEMMTVEKVTKDMVIGDVLKKYPDVAVIMLEHGLHCVGCHANVFDTIESGCRVHGLDDAVVDSLIEKINAFIAEAKAPPAPKSDKVTLTEVAAAKVKDLLQKENQVGHGLRVAVMPGGCSGFVYQMSFEEAPQKDDIVLEHSGVKLFLDKDSLQMLGGAEIDYVDSLSESGFKINNPNAKQGCGCGKSFG